MVEPTPEETQRSISKLNEMAVSGRVANTEYALAEALRRCLELAREGTNLAARANENGWYVFGQAQAKFDGIIAVADTVLAVYGFSEQKMQNVKRGK